MCKPTASHFNQFRISKKYLLGVDLLKTQYKSEKRRDGQHLWMMLNIYNVSLDSWCIVVEAFSFMASQKEWMFVYQPECVYRWVYEPIKRNHRIRRKSVVKYDIKRLPQCLPQSDKSSYKHNNHRCNMIINQSKESIRNIS